MKFFNSLLNTLLLKFSILILFNTGLFLLTACLSFTPASETDSAIVSTPNIQPDLLDPQSEILNNTPAVEVVLTPTALQTMQPNPTTYPPLPEVDFRIFYTVDNENDPKHSEIWVYDSITDKSELMYATQPHSIIIAGNVIQNPVNNNILYFVLMHDDNSWDLWKYEYGLTPTPITDRFPSGFGIIVDWSADGEWVRLYSEILTSSVEPKRSYLLVNVSENTMHTAPLGAFAWSKHDSSKFIIYLPDEPENLKIVDLTNLDKTIEIPVRFTDAIMENIALGFAPSVRIAWKPDNKLVFIEADNQFFTYEFQNEEWVHVGASALNTYLLDWSSIDGRLILNSSEGLYILETSPNTSLSYQLLEGNPVVLHTKLNDDLIIASKDNVLWLLNINFEEKRELFDLREVSINATQIGSLEVIR